MKKTASTPAVPAAAKDMLRTSGTGNMSGAGGAKGGAGFVGAAASSSSAAGMTVAGAMDIDSVVSSADEGGAPRQQ